MPGPGPECVANASRCVAMARQSPLCERDLDDSGKKVLRPAEGEVDNNSHDRFHAPAAGALHKKRTNNREGTGFEGGFTERTRVRYADAHLLHQPRWPWAQRLASRGVGASKSSTLKTDSAR